MRIWSEEDKNYLDENWGTVSIPTLATTLNRSIEAIKLKAGKMGLGRHLHSGEYITLNQLMQALGRGGIGTYALTSWVEKRGLPVKYKKTINKRYRVIYLNDFWKWAEKNKTFIDFAKFEENMLGEEPTWVKEQRKADQMFKAFKTTPWTLSEDDLLKTMLNRFCYSYRDISQRLMRTEGAIKRRMLDLKLKQRPLKAERHFWTIEETNILSDMYHNGYKAEIMANKINKSALAIKGKIEIMEKEGLLLKRVV